VRAETWASSAGADLLDQTLQGLRGPAALAGIVLEPESHGVPELLQAYVGDPSPRLALTRSKYKPSGKLTAYYELVTRDPRWSRRHVAVTWRTGALAAEAPAQRQDPGPRQGAASADGRVSLLVSPADPSMPQLGRLHDRAHLFSTMTALGQSWQGDVDDLRIQTIRYRPGQRHVLYVRSARMRCGLFVKTDRDDLGAHAVRMARMLQEVLPARCGGTAVAEPLGYLAEDRVAAWRQVIGQPLQNRLWDDLPAAVALVALVGLCARSVHDGGPELASAVAWSRVGSAAGSVAVELAATRRAGEHIVALLPGAGRTYQAVLDEVADRLRGLPSGVATVVHGDLKADNLVATGRRIRILDLDRCGWADPALDLAKFLADLRWWCAADRQRAALLSRAFRIGYGPVEPARWARADALAVAFDLKHAARRYAIHDPRWQALVRDQVERARLRLQRTRQP
jgi:hypothetical protein